MADEPWLNELSRVVHVVTFGEELLQCSAVPDACVGNGGNGGEADGGGGAGGGEGKGAAKFVAAGVLVVCGVGLIVAGAYMLRGGGSKPVEKARAGKKGWRAGGKDASMI